MSIDLKLDSEIEEVTSETHASGWTEKLGTFFEKALSATQNAFGTAATRDATTEQGAGASGKIPILDSGGKIPAHYAILDYLNFAADSFADDGLLKEDFQLKTLSFREFGNETISFEKFNIKGTPTAISIVGYDHNKSQMEWVYNNVLIGEIKIMAHETAISGWLECDGRSLSRSTYSELFAAIGTTYGSVDNNHFNIPDCRGRIIIGYSDSKAIGTKSGSETITLTETQIAEHSHNSTFSPAPSARNSLDRGEERYKYLVDKGFTAGNRIYLFRGTTNPPTIGLTDSIGNSEPIDIMQPYIVLSTRIYTGA